VIQRNPVTLSLKWLHHRRGVATVGIAALLICGVGMAPAVSSTLAARSGTLHGVFSGCLATSGAREVFNVVVKSSARPRRCPAGSTRVHWNARGQQGVNGADGSTGSTGPAGADGTNGADGSTGPAGADGTNGADGSTGPAGPGSMVSSGVFTLQASNQYPDTNAYLPLSGYLGTQVVAPLLDYDAVVTEAEHTSVEQVIAHDVTITDMYANFGSTTDLGGKPLQVQLTLLVSSGGTPLLVPAGGCLLIVQGNGPRSQDCSWPEEQAVHLTAGDVAVVYVHAYVSNWTPNSPIDIYGTVALTS
jgi:hypothetical protein